LAIWKRVRIEAVCVDDPANATGGDPGDAVLDSVAIAEFGGAVLE
jgi:hypothetical protein